MILPNLREMADESAGGEVQPCDFAIAPPQCPTRCSHFSLSLSLSLFHLYIFYSASILQFRHDSFPILTTYICILDSNWQTVVLSSLVPNHSSTSHTRCGRVSVGNLPSDLIETCMSRPWFWIEDIIDNEVLSGIRFSFKKSSGHCR